MTTFKNMTIEHLGDNATEEDLTLFRSACLARQEETGETDDEVTLWMWGQGDWDERVCLYRGSLCK